MTDTLQLRGLRLSCLCGVLPIEQTQRQPYEFNIDVVANLPATDSDKLNDTIDYGNLLSRIEEVTQSETFWVFERLAQRLAEVILQDYRVREVVVEVKKLRPPVPQFLDSSGVRIVRKRVPDE